MTFGRPWWPIADPGIKSRIERSVRVEPGEAAPRDGPDPRKPAANQRPTVRFNDHTSRDAVLRPGAGIETGVQLAVGLETCDAVSRHPVDGAEIAHHNDPPVEVGGEVVELARAATPELRNGRPNE